MTIRQQINLSDNNTEPIAIIGIGCRFPGGVNSPKDFWKLLSEGKDAITDIPKNRWSQRIFYHPDRNMAGKIYAPKGGFVDNIDKFDPEFFGISPREAASMDPQQRMLLETTWEAIEDAGMDPRNLAGSKVGVFIGLFMHDYENINSLPTERRIKSPHSATGMSTTIAANRISYIYDFKGPSMVVDTACSSSLITTHLACRSILDKESSIALAGGVNIVINPDVIMGLCRAGMLSPDGYSKSFDARANGYARAEGAGILVLKRLSEAIKDNDPIYSIIESSATNQDGRSDGQTVPSSEAQKVIIEEALKKAGLKSTDIQYFEAHGTGTPVGDPIEARSIGSVVSQGREEGEYCIMGSVKSNMGHTESAAGIASIIKTSLMLQHKKIPPNLNFKTPNPNIDFEKLRLRIPTSLEEWKIGSSKQRIAGINSFGFGGSNACVILKEFNQKKEKSVKTEKQEKRVLIPISGHNQEALNAAVEQCFDFLNSDEYKSENTGLQDIGYTKAIRRGHQQYRIAVSAKTEEELKEYLSAVIDGEKRNTIATGEAKPDSIKKLVFVFSGMGQQWQAMGRELLKKEPEFRKTVEKCDAIFREHTDEWSLLEELTKDEANSRINETRIAQPAIFSLQAGLNKLWNLRGVIPDAIIGHSVGEVAAAYAAGVLSLEDAICVCYNRSRLQQTTAGFGKMLAVGLSLEKAEEIITLYEDQVSIGAINSPSSITLAGDTKALEDIAEVLESENVFNKFLRVEVPYHSPIMDYILPDLEASLKSLAPRKSKINFVSTVTGKLIDGSEIDGKYWCKNARGTVRFQAGIEELAATGHNIFVEIGAHPVLSVSIKENLDANNKKGILLPSLRRKEDDEITLLNSLGQLYCIGYPIDWIAVYNKEYKLVRLPSYPWQRDTYWAESDEAKLLRIGRDYENQDLVHPLLGEKTYDALSTWRNDIDLWRLSYLKGHIVQGSIIYPAAAYFEMGMAAAKEKLEDEDSFMLEDIQIKAPMLLFEDSYSTIQLVINENDQFSIFSRNYGTGEWVSHLSGKIGINIDNKNYDKIDIDHIKSRCRQETKDFCYQRFHKLGLQYQEDFQLIENLWINEGEALAEIKSSKSIEPHISRYNFHPAMLDVCFQALAAMPVDGTYLPVKVESLKFFESPPQKIYSHAVIKNRNASSVKGDISVFDQEGKILLQIEGLTCQYVEGTRSIKQDSIKGNLYEYQWMLNPISEETATRDSSEYIISPGYIYYKIKKSIPLFIQQYKRKEFYDIVEPKFDNLCKEYIIEAFKKLGYEFEYGDMFSIETLITKLGVAKEHYLLCSRMLEILEQEKILKQTDNSWQIIAKPENNDVSKLWNRIFNEHPDYEAELMLFGRCGLKLAEILTGEVDSLSIIFPSGSLVAEHLYRNSPTFRIYNRMVYEAVSIIVNSIPEGQTLRILEIGAGTGSLASYVLPMFPKHRTEYLFTDISTAFTNQAAKKFSEYDFVDYKTLDIEKDPVEQGYDPNSFDLILASDAIHATANLTNTLNNVKSMLADNGILLLLEGTKKERWFDLVFGTLKGWWLFSDTDIRPNHPLLSEKKWLQLFKENGFSEVVALSDRIEEYEALHNVFIARGPSLKTSYLNQPIDLIEIPNNYLNRKWIIFADEAGISNRLSYLFKAKGINPIIVTKGDIFQQATPYNFTINPISPEDITLLFTQACTNSTAPVIVNMWNLKAPYQNKVDINLLEQHANQMTLEALMLVQAVSKHQWNGSPDIVFITNGTQTVGGFKELNVEQFPLWGFVRVVISEYTGWKTRLIDLSFEPLKEEMEALFKELISNSGEDEVALRIGKRYVHRFIQHHRTDFSIDEEQPFTLCKNPSKALDGFTFEETERKIPAPNQVEIEVVASALNFKDVATAVGSWGTELTPDGLISNFGHEAAGIITAVGEQVEEFKAGDEVMGFVTNGFSNYTMADSQLIIRKPANFSFEEAATVTIPFLTSYYALHNLAKIQPGEKILIHHAAESIGLAAIQIAKATGAHIFATTDTQEKKELLYSMEIQYVGDSNTLDFYNEISAGGEKLDIIINGNLKGRVIAKSMLMLKPVTGRFIDINEYGGIKKISVPNIQDKGIAYYSVSLDTIKENNINIIKDLFQKTVKAFNNKSFYPLAHRVFPLAYTVNAFQCMKDKNHIGKVIISMHEPGATIVPTKNKIPLLPDATYLMTGGLGGFGLGVAKWLIDCGAKHLVLLGRSGDSKPEAKKAVQELRDKGAEILVARVDVSKEGELKKLLGSIAQSMPPLRGVIHAAMVLEDVFLEMMTPAQLKKVMDPKMLGAWNLHIETLKNELDFFIMFSSFTSLVGNSGQANYSAGNAFLDLLSCYRKVNGLPAIAIGWGSIGNVGYVAEHEEIKTLFRKQGVFDLSLEQAWKVIAYGLKKELEYIGAMPIDWKKFSKYSSGLLTLPRFSKLIKLDKALSQDAQKEERSEFILPDSPDELKAYLLNSITKTVAGVLGIASAKLNQEQALEKYGLDSLMAVELNVQLKELTGIDFPKMTLLQKGLNIIELVEMIEKKILEGRTE